MKNQQKASTGDGRDTEKAAAIEERGLHGPSFFFARQAVR
jgi:hypothetical protein